MGHPGGGMLLSCLMQPATAESFSALTARGLVLVKYWADWCHPCQQIAPAVEALAASVPGLQLVAVNVDECRDLAKARGVRSIPALHLYRDGEPVSIHTGLADAEQIRQRLGL